MQKLSVCGILAVLSAAASPSPASASHLVSLMNEPVGQIAITTKFMATGPTTLVIFGGYQLPSLEHATGISVTASGRNTNLLKSSWTATAAPVGSSAEQAANRGLEFGGTVAGSYDLFSQDISTIEGQTYKLDFLFTQDYAGPSGMKVTVDETLADVQAESAVPEPSSWSVMIAGFGLIGLALRYARLTVLAQLAAPANCFCRSR